jgi:osmotically inducible protein OsmC
VAWTSRTERADVDPTPDEPHAAEHITCYGAALAHALVQAGTPPVALEATASLAPARAAGGSLAVDLEVRGQVPGLDQAGFEQFARAVEPGCAAWNALAGSHAIRVNATLQETADEQSGPLQADPPPVRPAAPGPSRPQPKVATAPVDGASRAASGSGGPGVVANSVGTVRGPRMPAALRSRRGARRLLLLAIQVLVLSIGVRLQALAPADEASAPATPVEVVSRAIAALLAQQQASTAAPTAPAQDGDGPAEAMAPPPSPQAASQPLPTATALFRAVLDERFIDNQRGWPHDPQGATWLADGAYRLFARQPTRFVAIRAPIAEPLRDAVVAATFRKLGGPAGGSYGLIVRDQGLGRGDGIDQVGRFYLLAAGDRGEVGIRRREGDRWVELAPWAPSTAVRSGAAANQLEARAIGRRLTLLVNGTEVASVEDAALQDGTVGVFAGGDLDEVAVERLTVQRPN